MSRAAHAIALALALTAMGTPALANTGTGVGGFAAGLSHPVHGLDHILAMIAVGLWAAQSGRRAAWAVPGAFMAAMVVGGLLALLGLSLPLVEMVIVSSVVVLGLLVAVKLRPMTGIGAAVVAVFGLFHGHAHGLEMPSMASPVLYAAGFLLATGVLHAFGVAATRVSDKVLAQWGERLVRVAGGAVAATGAVLLVM